MYTLLVTTSNDTGYSFQPEGFVYGSLLPQTFTRHKLAVPTSPEGIINGTMAVMLTDLDL
jgi:hypothetical protein